MRRFGEPMGWLQIRRACGAAVIASILPFLMSGRRRFSREIAALNVWFVEQFKRPLAAAEDAVRLAGPDAASVDLPARDLLLLIKGLKIGNRVAPLREKLRDAQVSWVHFPELWLTVFWMTYAGLTAEHVGSRPPRVPFVNRAVAVFILLSPFLRAHREAIAGDILEDIEEWRGREWSEVRISLVLLLRLFIAATHYLGERLVAVATLWKAFTSKP